MNFKAQLSRKHWQSATAIRDIFKQAFEAAGLPYYSPHRFRDTISAIGRKLCSTTEEQIAWARNMEHESHATTLMVYGGFSPDQQFEVIERLGRKNTQTSDNQDDIEKALLVLSKAINNKIDKIYIAVVRIS